MKTRQLNDALCLVLEDLKSKIKVSEDNRFYFLNGDRYEYISSLELKGYISRQLASLGVTKEKFFVRNINKACRDGLRTLKINAWS